MIVTCLVTGCGSQLASLRPVKLWHHLDGSHTVQYLDEEQPEPPLVRTYASSDQWVIAPDGEEFRVGACQGHRECPVEKHEHGCYADDGSNCDHPEGHPELSAVSAPERTPMPGGSLFGAILAGQERLRQHHQKPNEQERR